MLKVAGTKTEVRIFVRGSIFIEHRVIVHQSRYFQLKDAKLAQTCLFVVDGPPIISLQKAQFAPLFSMEMLPTFLPTEFC